MRSLLLLLPLSASLALGCGWIDKAAKEDTKIVVYSAGPATSVAIDGGEAFELSAGKFKSFAVGPGAHEVVFDGERKVSVTLEAFDRWVVPAAADQCFFSIDVSSSHYSADGKNRLGGPDIGKRQQQSEAFKFPTNHYLSEKELPNEVSSGTLLYMLRSLPCDELDRLEAGLSGEPAAEPAKPADPTLARLAEFGAAIGCDKPEGVAKAWCVAAGAWTHLDADAKLTLPDPGKAYVGLRVDLPASGDLAGVLETARLSVLALRGEGEGDGGMAYSDGVKPESEDETKQLDAAMDSIRGVFRGEVEAPVLPEGLASYVDSLPASANMPLTAVEHGWTVREVIELRQAGPLIAGLEQHPDGALTLSFHIPR